MIDAYITSSGLSLWGIPTGLRMELFAPAFFAALMSLRRSPEAGKIDKFLRVLTGTAFGMWGGWPLALWATSIVPDTGNLPRLIPILTSVSPESGQFLAAGLIGYAGFALVDRWLFPVRAKAQEGEQ